MNIISWFSRLPCFGTVEISGESGLLLRKPHSSNNENPAPLSLFLYFDQLYSCTVASTSVACCVLIAAHLLQRQISRQRRGGVAHDRRCFSGWSTGVFAAKNESTRRPSPCENRPSIRDLLLHLGLNRGRLG